MRRSMHFICGKAGRDAAARLVRARLLERSWSGRLTRSRLRGRLLLGAFFCEAGWYAEGVVILKGILHACMEDPSLHDKDIVLDTHQRLLASAVARGDVLNARHLADQLGRLLQTRCDLLAAAAAVQLASSHLLLEQWHEAVRWLAAAVRWLRPPLPADLAVELAVVGARLTLCLPEAAGPAADSLRRQMAGLAVHHWGQLHPQTVVALEILADHFFALGLHRVGRDLLTLALSLCDQLFGQEASPTRRVLLHRLLLERGEHQHQLLTGGTSNLLQRFNSLPPTLDGCLAIDQMLVAASLMESRAHMLPEELASRSEAVRAVRPVALQAVATLQRASQCCESLLGPNSRRRAEVLTELGRLYFSFSLEVLRGTNEDAVCRSEAALQQARQIQTQLGLPDWHRAALVTRTTLACLYTYSPLRYLGEAERLFQSVVTIAYAPDRQQYPDLAMHCMRGLRSIYAQRGQEGRADAAADAERSINHHRLRLQMKRAPPLDRLLPPQLLTDRQLLQQLSELLSRLDDCSSAGAGTPAPPAPAVL